MKRTGMMLLFITMVGCSTAPLADFLDILRPGRIRDEQAAPYGGVCQPKQATPLVLPSPPPIAPGPFGPTSPAPPPGAAPPFSAAPPPLAPTPSPLGTVLPPPAPATPMSVPAREPAPPINTTQPR